MEDRYEFLRTTEHEGQIVALIGDKNVLGDSGVKSLRQAFAAHAAPRVRSGVLMLSAAQLTERLPELERRGMTDSVAAFKRAVECIGKKNAAPAPKQQLSMSH